MAAVLLGGASRGDRNMGGFERRRARTRGDPAGGGAACCRPRAGRRRMTGQERIGGARRAVATAGVLGGAFLAAIETTVVAAAMPTVADQLGGLAWYSWVFSAYLLAVTVSIPLWGKLSDLYGRRRFYLACIGIFLFGSALSGAARSMPELILFRTLQGFGAGGLMPLGMSIIADHYTLEERGRTQGLLSAVWGLASVAGPLAGGYVTALLSWRWVFYLNIPFGILAAIAVGAALRDPPPGVRRPVDRAGAALLALSVTLLLLAAGQVAVAGRAGWAALAGGAAAASGWWLVRVERRAAEPMVPVDLLADRMVASIAGVGLLLGAAMFSAIAYVPLLVQEGLGGTAVEAGRALTPLVLGWVACSVAAGRVVHRTGYRPMVLGGLGVVTLAFVGLARVTADTPGWALRADLVLMGMGMGVAMLSLVLAMQGAVARRHLGVATSFGQFARSIGGAVGVALFGAVIAATLAGGAEPGPARMLEAVHRVFGLTAAVTGLAVLAALRMPGGRVSELAHPDHAPPTPGPAAQPAAGRVFRQEGTGAAES